MTLDRARSFGILLLGLLGCKAETFGGEDPVVDPAELSVRGPRIAGGYDTLSAPWMAQMADTMSVAIDDGHAQLAVRVTGDGEAFVFAIPAALGAGRHELSLLRSATARTPIGTLTTGGFTEVRLAQGSISGATQVDPYLPGMFGEGSGPEGGVCRIVALDARNATITSMVDAWYCGYGLGASYLAGRFLAYHPWSSGGWIRGGLARGVQVSDSLGMYGNWWPGHELAPGLYLKDEKYDTYLQGPGLPAWSSISNGNYRHPDHVAFSPDGRWAVPSHYSSIDGLLIVDRGSYAYHWAPGWRFAGRALFQRDGRLVAYGWRANGATGPYQEIIAHVDPVTGAIVDSAYFAEAGSPYDLPTLVAENGWIVLAGRVGDHLELSVRDPNSLREVAHAATPPFANNCYSYATYSVVEDPPYHRFYVVGNDCYQSIPIATFQLPE